MCTTEIWNIKSVWAGKIKKNVTGWVMGSLRLSIKEKRYIWTQEALFNLYSAKNQACFRMKGAEWSQRIRIWNSLYFRVGNTKIYIILQKIIHQQFQLIILFLYFSQLPLYIYIYMYLVVNFFPIANIYLP